MVDVANAERAYMTDPVFHRVVDTMSSLLVASQLTPHEMRAAATLACTHYEYTCGNGRRMFFVDKPEVPEAPR